MQLDQKADCRPWPLAGYAPGNYACKCIDCEERFSGDKRAIRCLECAAAVANQRLQAMPVPMVTEDAHQFKNFHRLLCELFGYCHDEKYWRRDQVSLIEHIDALTATASAEPFQPGGKP